MGRRCEGFVCVCWPRDQRKSLQIPWVTYLGGVIFLSHSPLSRLVDGRRARDASFLMALFIVGEVELRQKEYYDICVVEDRVEEVEGRRKGRVVYTG